MASCPVADDYSRVSVKDFVYSCAFYREGFVSAFEDFTIHRSPIRCQLLLKFEHERDRCVSRKGEPRVIRRFRYPLELFGCDRLEVEHYAAVLSDVSDGDLHTEAERFVLHNASPAHSPILSF